MSLGAEKEKIPDVFGKSDSMNPNGMIDRDEFRMMWDMLMEEEKNKGGRGKGGFDFMSANPDEIFDRFDVDRKG